MSDFSKEIVQEELAAEEKNLQKINLYLKFFTNLYATEKGRENENMMREYTRVKREKETLIKFLKSQL
jgi:HD superfamily phosphodiesterase